MPNLTQELAKQISTKYMYEAQKSKLKLFIKFCNWFLTAVQIFCKKIIDRKRKTAIVSLDIYSKFSQNGYVMEEKRQNFFSWIPFIAF